MESIGGIQQRYIGLCEQYSERASLYTKQIDDVSGKLVRLGWLRLLIFILLFAAPIYVYEYSIVASAILFVGFAIAFGVLVKRSISYRKYKAEMYLWQGLNRNERKAMEGDWSCFDPGSEFIDPRHDYSHDLDMFGEGSFFQYINRTSTLEGTNVLKNKICSPYTDCNSILTEQKSIIDLSERLDFRQRFFAKGKMLDETKEDINRIKSFKSYKPFFQSKGKLFYSLLIAMPILFCISLIFSFFELPSGVPIIIFLINLGIVGFNIKEINKINQQFSSLTGILQKYAILTDLIVNEKYSAEKLTALQSQLSVENVTASKIIRKLSKYMSQFDQRNSMFVGFLLNGFLLWDYRYVNKIELWLEKFGSEIDQWIDVVHEIDALNSMAGYVFNHPDFVFPLPQKQTVLQAKDLGHPLLDRGERVCNDYDFKESIFSLITGANMSGKSTFLRTVGLNLVLARCGMPVCASAMTFRPMSMITNMRTTDSLMKHESYFFAELKRLQYIIEQLKQGNDVFIILDEILKGTNSNDKTYGSMELIKHLLSLNAFGMIATHDLELGVLEDQTDGKIVNRCFEVENTDNKLHFDYKLQFGVTQNHNATFLMKRMGIIANN
ncbi:MULTISPECIES: MutS-related protein [unclassified Saccharicrinis]|uniref:MutS-related protein n=1 Tax=unclassified Saccharicrinis TaxID=2646859 RepID=UPI003D327C8B